MGKDHREEIRRYEGKLREQPDSLMDRYRLGMNYILDGQLEKACRNLEVVAEALFELLNVLPALEALYRRLGREDKAERIRDIVRGWKRGSMAFSWMKGASAAKRKSKPIPGPFRPDTIYTRTMAQIYRDQGHLKEAIEVLEGLLASHPEDAEEITEEIGMLKKKLYGQSRKAKDEELIEVLSAWIAQIRKKKDPSAYDPDSDEID